MSMGLTVTFNRIFGVARTIKTDTVILSSPSTRVVSILCTVSVVLNKGRKNQAKHYIVFVEFVVLLSFCVWLNVYNNSIMETSANIFFYLKIYKGRAEEFLSVLLLFYLGC